MTRSTNGAKRNATPNIDKPDSAARRMARKLANYARDELHDVEDEEREQQGNHRPRQKADDPT